MAGALWIKEQMFCYFSCDTRLQEDDNIENKLMNTHTHTQADLPLKISLALLGFERFSLKQLSLESKDLFPAHGLTCFNI